MLFDYPNYVILISSFNLINWLLAASIILLITVWIVNGRCIHVHWIEDDTGGGVAAAVSLATAVALATTAVALVVAAISLAATAIGAAEETTTTAAISAQPVESRSAVLVSADRRLGVA